MNLLERIHRTARRIERQAQDENFPEKLLEELVADLRLAGESEDLQLRRLAGIADHLHPEMSLRHFVNFMIPVERLVSRSLKDGDFLIRREDANHPTATRDRPNLRIRNLEGAPIFILENLRSGFNVGSIFRLADAVGARAVFLAGYTPSPGQPAVAQAALGAEKSVPSKQFFSTKEALEEARALGYRIVALETCERSQGLYETHLPAKIAWLVGNERFGLEAEILSLCDEVRSIPQAGMKNSLNVAVALGVAAFEGRRQQGKKE